MSCQQHARLADLPPCDRVSISDNWRVAHAWGALPGWLVIIARRHVVSLSELSAEEASELGLLMQQLSSALCSVTGSTKTYVAMFAERPGFEHLHVHVIPRMHDFAVEHRGPGVFEFLKRPEAEWVPEEMRNQFAGQIAQALARSS